MCIRYFWLLQESRVEPQGLGLGLFHFLSCECLGFSDLLQRSISIHTVGPPPRPSKVRTSRTHEVGTRTGGVREDLLSLSTLYQNLDHPTKTHTDDIRTEAYTWKSLNLWNPIKEGMCLLHLGPKVKKLLWRVLYSDYQVNKPTATIIGVYSASYHHGALIFTLTLVRARISGSDQKSGA